MWRAKIAFILLYSARLHLIGAVGAWCPSSHPTLS